ncbi:MAG: hypothetical protein ACUVRK_09820, partial [Spirochaetota bacterium]
PVNLMVEVIDNFEMPLRVKDTYTGKLLIKKRNQLYEKLLQYSEHYTDIENKKTLNYSII